MKNNLFSLITFALICSCKQSERNIYFNTSNPTKPIIAAIIPNAVGDSLKINIHTVDEEKAAKIMAVYLVTDNTVAANKIMGNYFLKDDSLQFIPYFELGYGLDFEVQLYINGDTIKKRFSTPKAPIITAPLTEAIQIFPLTDKIPSNILCFHALFSSPMNEDGVAFTKVQLIDEAGSIKPKVWKEKSYWTDSAKCLVLMIHPGRIKRGINYLSQLGPVFEVGKKYTIVLTTKLKDKYNRPLHKEYKKTFTAIAPDRQMPKLMEKEFKKPASGTRNPLQIKFSEAMDYGSLRIGFKVFDEKNQLVQGKIAPTNNDSLYSFMPNSAWQKQTYRMECSAEVSDLASNHLHRLFETKSIKEFVDDEPIKWNFIPD